MDKIENKEAGILYERVKEVFFSFKKEPTYKYDKHQHHLYEESEHPGISRDFYNENGSVEFVNSNGDTIVFELSRFHTHQHNGWSGLCGAPCRLITISKKCGEELEELWRLEVVCRTLHYEGNVTSLEVPYDLLLVANSNVEDKIIEEKLSMVLTEEKSTEVDSIDWNEELTKVNSEYDEYLKLRDSIIAERDKKIARINGEYSVKINDCDTNMKKCLERREIINNKLNNFSSFDIKMLGCALSHLISTIECSEYYYREVNCNCKKRVYGVMDSWDEDYQKKVHLITDDKNMKSINEDEFLSKNIVLIDSENVVNTSSESFPYVQEFIQYVIKYRMENGLENFSGEEMVSLLQSFLEAYQDRIIEKYKIKIKNKIGNIKL